MVTFTEAYKSAGYVVRNPRNQWSARKTDGTGVALSVWSDEIDRNAEPWVVDTRGHPEFDEWGGRTGNAIRKKYIAFALERLGGRVDLILCVAVDPAASPRKVKIARHWSQRWGLLDPESFDPKTGVFRMELHPV